MFAAGGPYASEQLRPSEEDVRVIEGFGGVL